MEKKQPKAQAQPTPSEIKKYTPPPPVMHELIINGAKKIELIQHYGTLNVPAIVAGNFPTIGSLKTTLGLEQSMKCTGVIIGDLSRSFNNELDDEAIEEISAELHHSILVNLSLESLYLTCARLKSGKVFKLNTNAVLRALNEHLNELSIAFQERNYNAHLATKHDTERLATRQAKKEHAQKLSAILNNNQQK
jgi:hypothetical protein